VSGAVPLRDRAGGKRVLDLLNAGTVEGVVFVRLDRLFRSTSDCVRTVDDLFRPRGWQLASLVEQLDTTSSMGRFLLRMFASLAELERDRIGERVSEAMRHLVAQGVRVGGAGYGWCYGNDLDEQGRKVVLPVQGEQRTVRRARQLRRRGLTLRAIAAELAREGHATKRGGARWHPKVVRDLLRD
jgi:site-specific DNA recombinase